MSMSPEKRGPSRLMATPPAIHLSGLRPAASTRSTWDCSLVRGTAQSFNLFRQAPPFHAAVRSQGFCDRQCVARGRVHQWPHVPKRPAAVVLEGATVKTAEFLWFCRLAGHGASLL